MSTLKTLLKNLDMPRYNKRLANLHKQVFNTSEGRELLLDYINRFHILDTPEVKTDRERFEIDGARAVIQHMLAYVCCDGNDFLGKVQDNFED